MAFTHQLFTDEAGKNQLGSANPSGYDTFDDAKMRAHEWFNSSRLNARAGSQPEPMSVKLFDNGKEVFHWTFSQEASRSTRKAVLHWNDAKKAKP